jgi:hypothetical protein
MVFVNHRHGVQSLVVGPWTTAGQVHWQEGAEILWIQFKLGTFMPQLPAKCFRDSETSLPKAAGRGSFWLNGSAWQVPNFENVDTFVNRLARAEVLVCDPVVVGALQERPQAAASRTVRHRFLQATGLSQNHIRQYERAQQAAALLQQGKSILDTAYDLGYYDQPHLTRSLKQFFGYTPAQIGRVSQAG